MARRIAVFDVLGTVVDERGSFRAALTEALPAESRVQEVADRWLNAVSDEVRSVAQGDAEWRPWDEMVRDALHRVAPVLDAHRATVAGAVGHRLAPWPDSVRGLAAIKSASDVVALSNAGILPLMDTFRVAGLDWSTVLSSEMVRSTKPDPRVYAFLLDQLRLPPDEVVMIAAHPWDLRAAAATGMRTAYVRRSGEGEPDESDHFDWYADDLIDLAQKLAQA